MSVPELLPLKNSSFEHWTNGVPDHWEVVTGTVGRISKYEGKRLYEGTEAYEMEAYGRGAVKVEGYPHNTEWIFCRTREKQLIPVLPNSKIRLSFWSKKILEGSSPERNKYVEVWYLHGSEWRWLSAINTKDDPLDRWCPHREEYNVPADAQKLSVGVVVHKHGAFAVDHIRLKYVMRCCGVNYYPARHSWERMWTEWSPGEITTELTKAQEMGVNAARTFIADYNLFGGSNCNSSAIMYNRLDKFLDIASSRDIKLIITLFEGDRNTVDRFVSDIEGSRKFIECFAQRFGNDQRILMWDIINEPDGKGFIDHQSGWKPNHLSWLKNIYQYLKSKVIHPITLGTVTNIKWIVELCRDPLFNNLIPQYHEYSRYDTGSPETFMEKIRIDINDLWNGCGRRPIFIGEFGSPGTLNSSSQAYFDMGWTEESQRERTDLFLRVVSEELGKIYGIAFWTLNDFKGPLFDPTGQQEYFGLLRSLSGYTRKPSADIVSYYYKKWVQ